MKNRIFSKLFILVLILLLGNITYGQKNFLPGYVINLKGDTIKGLINYRNWDTNPKKIDFKKSADGKIEYITPAGIKEFGVADEIYKSGIAKVDESFYGYAYLTYSEDFKYRVDTAFLQTLVQGDKSLYRYKDFNGKEHFLIGQNSGFELLHFKKYLKNEDGQIIISLNNKFIRQLYYYLQDCPGISEKLERIQYTQNSLSNIFYEYYNCKNKKVTFRKKEENSSIDFGVFTGFSITKLKFKGVNNDDLVNTDYSPSKDLTFGLFLDYSLPKNLNKWSVYNELLYTSFKTNGEYSENSHSTIYTTLEYAYIKINNMLRYNYPIGGISLYLNAGMSNGFGVKETNYRKTVTVFPSDKVEEGLALKSTRKYEPGLVAGIGSKYKKLFIEARYEKGSGMSKFVDLKSPVERIYFLFGYRF